jgi:hypothetical protein
MAIYDGITYHCLFSLRHNLNSKIELSVEFHKRWNTLKNNLIDALTFPTWRIMLLRNYFGNSNKKRQIHSHSGDLSQFSSPLIWPQSNCESIYFIMITTSRVSKNQDPDTKTRHRKLITSYTGPPIKFAERLINGPLLRTFSTKLL